MIRRGRQLAACEFNGQTVRVLLAREKRLGAGASEPVITGFGEAPSEGFREGRFWNLSDAAECVARAARIAEIQAGERISRLAVNLDDPFLESVRVRGSSSLEKGLDGFQDRHIEEAVKRALQSVKPSEKHLVYRGIAAFLIDDEDCSASPLGIYGKELTAVMHLLFSNSSEVQNVRSVVTRAGFEPGGVFTSLHCALAGTAAEDDSQEKTGLVLSSGKACHVGTSVGGALLTHDSVLIAGGYDESELDAAAKIIRDRIGDARFWVVGDDAGRERLIAGLEQRLGAAPQTSAARISDARYGKASFAVLAGLLRLTRHHRRPRMVRQVDLEVVRRAAQRAKSFVQEYF